MNFLQTQLGFSILLLLAILAIMMICVAYLIFVERKVAARVQDRIGPNRAGPWGLLQPIADGIKFLLKEDFIPGTADKRLFILAPCISMTVAMVGFAVIPWGGLLDVGASEPVRLQVASVDIGLLYVLGMGAMGVYGIVLTGWSSNNKFSFYGAMRAAAQTLSYEIPMGLAVLVVALTTGEVRLESIVSTQMGTAWNILLHPLAFLVFLTTAFAETYRAPFDLAESEQELIGGYNTEYSSMKMAMFFLGEYAHLFTISAFMATLFLGGWELFPFSDRLDWGWLNWLYHSHHPLAVMCQFFIMLGKVTAFILFFMWVRWTLFRPRFDQLMRFAWNTLVPATIAMAVVTMVLVYVNEAQTVWATISDVGVFVVAVFAFWVSRTEITGRQPALPPVGASTSGRTE